MTEPLFCKVTLLATPVCATISGYCQLCKKRICSWDHVIVWQHVLDSNPCRWAAKLMLGDEVLLAFRLIFIETIKKKSYQNEND